MRRLILNIVCLFPLWLTAAAGTFSLSTVSGHVGDTVTVTASLSDFSGVAALQMTLQLGEHLRYLPGSATLSSSQTSHQVMAGGSNGKLIVNVYNYTGATLIGSSGNLFSFQLVLGNEPASYPLQSEVLLSNASGTGIAVTSSAGSVTLLAPKIQIVTQELNFGHIPIRSTYLQTLTVRNIGNESLHISNTEFSAVEFSAEQTECTIPAGSSQDITINYTPVQHGAVSETLRLRSDAINDANVYGDNLVLLNADPYSVNELHVQPAEGISDDTVTVTLSMNNMETNLVGLQVSFVLPPQLIFVESSTTPLSRASDLTAASSMSNDTLTLYLFSFNNTAITGEEGNLMTFQLRLNGDGWYNLEPLNAVLTNPSGENMVSAVYSNYVKIQSPEMSVWPYPLSFDSVPITSRDTAICNIYNYGQAPLIVSKVTFLQEGFRVVTPLPVTLEQYNSIPLEVEFSPKVDGAVSTIMQIYSNDPNNRMKSVEVTAQVYEPNKLLLSGELQEDNSYLLSVGLENYTPILGVQFDIICPSGLTPQSFVPSERLQGLSLIMQSVGNNTWRVIVYSLTGASVSSGNGVIGTFGFSAEETSAHSREIITISRIVLSDVHGNNRSLESEIHHTIAAKYVVSFVNEDGSILQRDTIMPGLLPTYRGEIPSKASTEEYSYIFVGWNPTIVPVSEDAVYTATYISVARRYRVEFHNADGTVLQSDSLGYNTWPSYYGDTPQKENTAQYTYYFAGWSPAVASVVGDVVYTAIFDSVLNYYSISFLDGNGLMLWSESQPYGAMPEYTGPTPTKSGTAQYTFTFVGWSPAFEPITSDVTYTAIFDTIVNRYVITFYDYNWTILQQDTLPYGSMPEYREPIPLKEGTAQFSYSFEGWSPSIEIVTGDASYLAIYAQTENKYLVTFLNEDRTLLQSDSVLYGYWPSYNGETPTKRPTVQYSYVFSGWNPIISPVVEDAIYVAMYDSVLNYYTIIFQDENGFVLQTENLPYGSMPEYRGAVPSKAGTQQETYYFAGWSPAVVPVIGDAVYTATYTQTINRYVVTFFDETGGVLQRDTLDYGSVPLYSGATPTKPATAQYTYTFVGWSPLITPVYNDANYTAVFDSVVNWYIVMFLNEDSTLLQIDTLAYGALPEYRGTTPAKSATAQYTYTFAGWDTSVLSVTRNAIYTATYASTVNKYVVTFLDEDNTTILQRDTLDYGTMPAYRGGTPSKQATAQYSYTFAGWSPTIESVSGNATYTATYASTLNKYVVTFVDEDGTTILQRDTLDYGSMPAYRGGTPSKQVTAQYSYTFAGWSPAITSVTGEATYTATYASTVNKYVVTFVDEDNTLLQRDTLDYGSMPAYRGGTPSKPATAQYTYTFAGWSPAIESVSGNATYTATYASTLNKYVVTFVDEDNTTILQRDTLDYGSMPVYYGAEPAKQATDEFTYSFIGWTPSLTAVVGDATYTATFDSIVNMYTIMFLNSDSSLLQLDTLPYGAMPEYRGEEPVKPMEGEYFFVFTGWEPSVVAVTGNAIYIATYESHGTGVALPDESKQPIKLWRDGKMYILLPNGQVFDSTGKKVE